MGGRFCSSIFPRKSRLEHHLRGLMCASIWKLAGLLFVATSSSRFTCCLLIQRSATTFLNLPSGGGGERVLQQNEESASDGWLILLVCPEHCVERHYEGLKLPKKIVGQVGKRPKTSHTVRKNGCSGVGLRCVNWETGLERSATFHFYTKKLS